MTLPPDYRFDDFTETEYRNLLRLAKENWEFVSFPDFQKGGRICLWRHDIDVSVHRAYRLAQIEAEEGVKATYFVHLHSKFYNAMEDVVMEKLSGILELGHMLGLHFDPQVYVSRTQSRQQALDLISFEQQTLQNLFMTNVSAFSFHHPDIGGWLDFTVDAIGGMVNAYGSHIREHFRYCSDSNGYWRFQRLKDLLETAADSKLHVLTHPEWWQSSAMSPRERILRAIEGRAFQTREWYEKTLIEMGRQNVR